MMLNQLKRHHCKDTNKIVQEKRTTKTSSDQIQIRNPVHHTLGEKLLSETLLEAFP